MAHMGFNPFQLTRMNSTVTLIVCIQKAGELWFGGQFPPQVAGMEVSAAITEDRDAVAFRDGFNAGHTTQGDKWCVTATELVMNPQFSQVGRDFTLLHELSHIFASEVAGRLGIAGRLTGQGDEVLPDLIAAYLLTSTGLPWDTLLRELEPVKELVFDADNDGRAGNHPPAGERLQRIRELRAHLAHTGFDQAVAAILRDGGYLTRG